MTDDAPVKLSYNLREAQDALGIKRTTLLKYLRESQIAFYYQGNRRYIRADELMRFHDLISGGPAARLAA